MKFWDEGGCSKRGTLSIFNNCNTIRNSSSGSVFTSQHSGQQRQCRGCWSSYITDADAGAERINTMPDNAARTLNAGERRVIHRDSGEHYCWSGWLKRVIAECSQS